MAVILYGIRNCDTVKKARAWLDARHVAYVFHDFKLAGVDADLLARWIAAAGWEKVLNRAGMTFRALPDAAKAHLDATRATQLMVAAPAMIKRPILEVGGAVLVGFSPDAYIAAGLGTRE